jgi:hypothetical protein
MITRKQIVDSILILMTKFSRTDETRLDENYLAFLVEEARVTEIINEYNVTGVIDQNWLIDFGIIDLTKVNFADDPNVDFCSCDIMKAEIPSVMNLTALGEGNLDLGLKVISACGSTNYTMFPLERWRMIPKEHVRSKFYYYQRFGNIIYVNKLANSLRFYGIPETTEGLIIKKTLPIDSGNLKNGYVYMVKGSTGIVTYDGVNYLPGQTFTANSVTAYAATGDCKVYYNNFEYTMTDTDQYPVSAHLARQIVISVISTELNIERQQVTDVVNDSADDVLKNQ